MLRIAALAYAFVAYAAGMAVLALFGAFLLGFDLLARAGAPLAEALAVDIALIALFGVQHSVMARPAFKEAWTRLVPRAIERSTYVIVSALALGALIAFWKPTPGVLWEASGGTAIALYAVFGLGAAILVSSTFMIDHFDLFGLKQAWNAGRTCRPSSDFRVVLLYRLVRHPIMLGFLVMFWAVPRMTLDHLVLSLGLTAYILVALHFEERDLVEEHGEAYRRYRREVSALIPLPRTAGEEPVAPARR
jgi:protein-S-isoprenylcysteine O-methyltransferase Ste14